MVDEGGISKNLLEGERRGSSGGKSSIGSSNTGSYGLTSSSASTRAANASRVGCGGDGSGGSGVNAPTGTSTGEGGGGVRGGFVGNNGFVGDNPGWYGTGYGMYGGGYGGYYGGRPMYGGMYGGNMGYGVTGMDGQYSWIHSIQNFTSSLTYLTEVLGVNVQAITLFFRNLLSFLESTGDALTYLQPWRKFPLGHPRHGEPPPTEEQERKRLSRLRIIRFLISVFITYAGYRFLRYWNQRRGGHSAVRKLKLGLPSHTAFLESMGNQEQLQ